MLYFKSVRDAFGVFDAMGSEIRLQIVELLLQYKIMNMDSLAKRLHLSNGGLTPHIKKLENAGIVKVTEAKGNRGVQKQCSLVIDKLLIDLSDGEIDQTHTLELDVGQFDRQMVSAPCGLGTAAGLIGEPNAPKYFDYPSRFNASILWFSGGAIEYKIPCAHKKGQRMNELQIYFEINSFDKSTEIFFEINSVRLGLWTAPDKFSDRLGFFTPKWCSEQGSYGILKALTVSKKGSFINDLPIGNLTIDDLLLSPDQSFIFRIVAPKNGTVCLFGKGFGDYDIGIKVSQIAV